MYTSVLELENDRALPFRRSSCFNRRLSFGTALHHGRTVISRRPVKHVNNVSKRLTIKIDNLKSN